MTKLKYLLNNITGITRKQWRDAYDNLLEEYGVLATQLSAVTKEYEALKKEAKKTTTKKTATKKTTK